MLRCPICSQEASDTQVAGGRCPHCGGIVRWTNISPESNETLGDPTESPAPAQPPPSAVYSTINPRDLSPEMQRTMDAMWEGADRSNITPQMTIKNNSATIWGGLDLVIPARRLRKAGDVELTARADYELGHIVGEGGVGTVFSARQASINRTVAIKMLREGIDADLANREKFLAEAVVTGELEHPNIVPIYDVGSSSKGQLFYSMKLVHGTPWNMALEHKSLTENLNILMRVCDAVAFAHDKGVIHRDLKPENVMLGGYGEVLVMDWGIAISTELLKKDPNIKKSVGMGGTPAYMAPEMASGPLESIDRRSDVYLLGAILFEIITGNAPHTGNTVTSCLFAAARNEIVPTDKSGELLDIAYKALSTNRHDRHQSVEEFQNAIRGYQSHAESISLARRAERELADAKRSGDYQEFSRTLFGFQEAISLWPENESARRGLAAATITYASKALEKGDFDLGLSLLDADDRETAPLYKSLVQGKQERELRQQRLRNVRRMVTGLLIVIFLVVSGFLSVVLSQQSELASRNAELVRTSTSLASKTKSLQQREKELLSQAAILAQQTEQLVERQNDLTKKNSELEFERNLARRLTVEAQESENAAVQSRQVALYRSYLAQIGLAAAKIDENAFSDASRILDTYADSPLKHWEWGRLRRFQQLDLQTIAGNIPIDSVAYSADGSRAAIGRRNGTVEILPVGEGGGEVVRIETGGQYVFDLEFSPDGSQLATAGDAQGNYLALWDTTTGARMPNLFEQEPHTDWCLSVSFSRNGKLLLSTSYDKTAKLWSLPSGKLSETLAGHHRPVWDAAIAPDGRTIVTASEDGTAIVWRDPTGAWDRPRSVNQIMLKFTEHRGPLYAVAFSPLGNLVATAGHGNRIKLWNPDDVKPFAFNEILASNTGNALRKPTAIRHVDLEGHRAAVRSLAFSAQGDLLLSGASDNTMMLWNVKENRLVKQLRGHSDAVSSCTFAPHDSGVLLSGSFDGSAKFWSVAGYQEQKVLLARVLNGHDDAVLAASFDAEGKRIVTASRDRTARIWNLAGSDSAANDPLVLREGHEYLVSTTLFTPDGQNMITAAMDNTVRIWDIRTGAELHSLAGTGRRAVAAVSDNGQWLLTAGDDNAGQLFDLSRILSGENAADALTHVTDQPRAATVTAAVFTQASGGSFAFGDEFGRCTLYLAQENGLPRQVWNVEAHAEEITSLAYLPLPNQLATASLDGTIRFRDLADGTEDLTRRLAHPGAVVDFAVLNDGQQILSACADGKLRLWNATDATLVREFAPLAGGPKSLAANVRRAMSQRGWNEQDLTRQAQLELGLIRRVLGGNYDLPADASRDEILTKLSALFGIPARDLLVSIISSVDIDSRRQVAVTSCSVEGTVQFWNLATGEQLNTEAIENQAAVRFHHEKLRGAIASAGFVPGSELLVISGGRRSETWGLATGEPQMEFSPHGAIAAAQFSSDGKWVVSGSWDGSAKVWNAETGLAVMRLSGGHAKPINSAMFSPDGSRVLTASDDGTARLWDWEAGRLLEEPLFRHSAAVRAAVYSPDGRYVATACDDATVGIWDAATGKQLHRLEGHRSAVLCAAFSRDSQYLLTGSRDQTARIWHVASGTSTGVAQGHTSDVNSVAFSPDGRRAITGSSDQSAKLFDAQPPVEAGTGTMILQEVLTLNAHSDAVTSTMFSPRGDSILTAGRDGTVILWEAEPIAPSLFLAENDLVLSESSAAELVAPQAVFSAPNRVEFTGTLLHVELLSEGVNSGRLAIESSSDRSGSVVLEDSVLLFVRSANERVPFADLVVPDEDESKGVQSLRIAFQENASHAMIQQFFRQLKVVYANSEQAAAGAIVQATMTFPDAAEADAAVRSQRVIRGQQTLKTDMAVR